MRYRFRKRTGDRSGDPEPRNREVAILHRVAAIGAIDPHGHDCVGMLAGEPRACTPDGSACDVLSVLHDLHVCVGQPHSEAPCERRSRLSVRPIGW